MAKPTQRAYAATTHLLFERLAISHPAPSYRRFLQQPNHCLRSLSTTTTTTPSTTDTVPPPPSRSESRKPKSPTPSTKYSKASRAHSTPVPPPTSSTLRTATVLRAGTMSKTIKIRVKGQKYDSFLRKHYPWHTDRLCHDEEGLAREGDVISVGGFRGVQTPGGLRAKSDRVKLSVRGVVSAFGTPVAGRERLRAPSERKGEGEADNEEVEKFAGEVVAETKAHKDLMVEGLENQIDAEEGARRMEEEEGVGREELRRKAEQVGR